MHLRSLEEVDLSLEVELPEFEEVLGRVEAIAATRRYSRQSARA